MTIVEKAVQWAVNVAKENKSGYDQAHRWGSPDYDCSSFVISAYRAAGVPIDINVVSYTGNMNRMVNYGFKKMGLQEAKPYRPGDIFVNTVHHTVMYIGNGQIVQASINEKGTATGGKPGDQTGNEINIRSFYTPSYGWSYVLRYQEDEEMSYEQWKEYNKKYMDELEKEGVPQDKTDWQHKAWEFVTMAGISDGFRPFAHVTRVELWGMLRIFYQMMIKTFGGKK